METTKMFFAGYGGQGVLMIGQILTYAAMNENKEVTFMPAYGPEMRGGTANCTVIVSDKKISCPVIYEADLVTAMNPPSLTKYEELVKPGGKLFINTSICTDKSSRSDVDVFEVAANDIAMDLGNSRGANIVMLGAINRTMNLVSEQSVKWVLQNKVFSGKKAKLFDINWQCYHAWQNPNCEKSNPACAG